MPRGSNEKDGSLYLSVKQLASLFFRSRFNRDNLNDLMKDEDIDDSSHSRIYNKKDIEELSALYAEFFEWVINAKNVSRIYITPNVVLKRTKKLPRLTDYISAGKL